MLMRTGFPMNGGQVNYLPISTLWGKLFAAGIAVFCIVWCVLVARRLFGPKT